MVTDFPANEFERDLDAALTDDFLEALDRAGYEWDWPRVRRGMERWIEAQEHGLDNAAREQEMEV